MLFAHISRVKSNPSEQGRNVAPYGMKVQDGPSARGEIRVAPHSDDKGASEGSMNRIPRTFFLCDPYLLQRRS